MASEPGSRGHGIHLVAFLNSQAREPVSALSAELRVDFLVTLGTILLFGLGCRGPLLDTVLPSCLDFGSEFAALFFGFTPFGFSLARNFFLIALHITCLPRERERSQHWTDPGHP